MTEFGLEIIPDSDIAVLALRGDVDIASRDAVVEAAVTLLRGGHPVIADLTKVCFMDSSGLSALIRARKEADRLGCDFRITGARDEVKRLLEITGLTAWLEADNTGCAEAEIAPQAAATE
jgi:anti-anti-sigma factor